MQSTKKMKFFQVTIQVLLLLLFFGGITPARDTRVISPGDLLELIALKKAPLILDVRTRGEFAHGHVPGAVNIPHQEIHYRLNEIENHKDKEIIVYCRSGRRVGIAEKVLRHAGFLNILYLQGNMRGWLGNNLPLE